MKPKWILKFISLIIASAMLTPVFSSCAGDEERLDKYKTDDIADGVYLVDEDVSCVYPYDNRIYAAKGGCEVGYYDAGFEAYTSLNSAAGEKMYRIFVNGDGIFCAGSEAVVQLDFDGKIKRTYAYPALEGDGNMWNSSVCVSEGYVTAAVSRYSETESGEKSDFLVFLSADLSKEDAELEVIGEKYTDDSYVRSFVPGNKADEVYVMTQRDILRLNPKTGECEVAVDKTNHFSAIDLLPGEDVFHTVYEQSFEARTHNLGEITTNGSSLGITRSIPYYRIYDELEAALSETDREVKDLGYLQTSNCMVFTGHDYIMLDTNNSAVYVYAPYVNDAGETLTVIGHADNPDKDDYIMTTASRMDALMNAKFEEDENVRVNYQSYTYDEFSTKLRLDMMSGSGEYDVVMLGDAHGFLANILKNKLYLPLEGYADISAGFDKYFDGVREVMTYDGHLYGVPVFLSTNTLTMSREPLIDENYTFDEFWELYDNGVYVTGRYKTYMLFLDVMKSVIEDGMEKGEISRDAIVECLELFAEYYPNREPDIEYGSAAGKTVYDINFGVGGTIYSDSKLDDARYKPPKYLRRMPSYNNKNYVSVDSMTYVSSATKVPDIAAKYLAYMVSDDFIAISNGQYQKSFLVKEEYMDLYGSYYQPPSMWINGILDDPLAFGYRWKKYPLAYGMSKYDTFLVENGDVLFEGAAPRLYSYGMDEVLKEVYEKSGVGMTMTVDEAADLILKEAKYRLME